ncbi:MAG: hypothetical protein IIX16_08390 [Clostridia bacterium]|nr:hypothetical protein [Clostridia bacterium]
MFILADVFQDNMVFQRHKPINVFGVAQADQTLYFYLDNELVFEADVKKGDFQVSLPAQEAMENVDFRIESSAGETIPFKNIDIGEVWLAGGQSNMEFLMKYEEIYEYEKIYCEDEHLRFYNVPQYSFFGEEHEGFKEKNGYNKWHRASRENLWCFSAAGYYHAKHLRAELGVPVAILGCNWGGTSASAWMDMETLKSDPELRVYCDDYEKIENLSPDYADKEYRNRRVSNVKFTRWVNDMLLYGYGENKLVQLSCTVVNAFRPKDIGFGWQSFQRPAGLYSTMLKKIIGYNVKGVIWYQGESDDYRANIYSNLFSKMIERWRSYWNDEFPFLFVQIAPFEPGKTYPELRHQQEIVEKMVKDAYMVSIPDIGMKQDIHPKNKHDVGYRLALKALGKVYGKDVVCDAPYADKAELQGNNIILHFADCEELIISGGALNAMRIISEDGAIKMKSCSVDGNTLTLKTDCAGEKKHLRVEFAWTPYHEVNLYNEGGLPAKPFRIEIG